MNQSTSGIAVLAVSTLFLASSLASSVATGQQGDDDWSKYKCDNPRSTSPMCQYLCDKPGSEYANKPACVALVKQLQCQQNPSSSSCMGPRPAPGTPGTAK
jgi:hypothetical protein